ncbi:partner of bursicon-like isoform X2 [Asterias amurensis]
MAPTQHHHPLAAMFIFSVLSMCLLPDLVQAVRRGPAGTCEVGISFITVEEEFESSDGGSVISCTGTTTVNQCEGECVTTSTPSVTEPTGYSKICNCCRERSLRPKQVMLSDCYDSAGNAITGQQYPVYVPEPASCSCQKCSR